MATRPTVPVRDDATGRISRQSASAVGLLAAILVLLVQLLLPLSDASYHAAHGGLSLADFLEEAGGVPAVGTGAAAQAGTGLAAREAAADKDDRGQSTTAPDAHRHHSGRHHGHPASPHDLCQALQQHLGAAPLPVPASVLLAALVAYAAQQAVAWSDQIAAADLPRLTQPRAPPTLPV